MARINVGNALFGVLVLLLVGVGIVHPTFPEDGFDVLWLLVAFATGLTLLLRSAGPRTVRLQLLEWRTSRQGKVVEWGGGAILATLFLWDFGMGFPALLLAAFALGRVLGGDRYYKKLDDEKQRLRQNADA